MEKLFGKSGSPGAPLPQPNRRAKFFGGGEKL